MYQDVFGEGIPQGMLFASCSIEEHEQIAEAWTKC
jgi:hypothetical protein